MGILHSEPYSVRPHKVVTLAPIHDRLLQSLKNTDRAKFQEYTNLLSESFLLPSPDTLYSCYDYSRGKRVALCFLDHSIDLDRFEKIQKKLSRASERPYFRDILTNIVQVKEELTPVTDSNREKLQGFISREEDPGDNYKDFLHRLESPLSSDKLLSFFYQMARAVGLLHSLSVIHNNLSADSFIVITTKRGNHHLKLRNLYRCHPQVRPDPNSSRASLKTTTFDLTNNRALVHYISLEKAEAIINQEYTVKYPMKDEAWVLGLIMVETILAGAGPSENRAQYLERIESINQEFRDISRTGFQIRIKQIDKLMTECLRGRKEEIPQSTMFLIFKGLLQVDFSQRIDVLSTLLALKLIINREFREKAQFIEDQVMISARRPYPKKKVLVEHEELRDYISKPCVFDKKYIAEGAERTVDLSPFMVSDSVLLPALDRLNHFLHVYNLETNSQSSHLLPFRIDIGAFSALSPYSSEFVIAGLRKEATFQNTKHIAFELNTGQILSRLDLPIELEYSSLCFIPAVHEVQEYSAIGGATCLFTSPSLFYRQEPNEWREGPILLNPRKQPGVVFVSGFIYAFGGTKGLQFQIEQQYETSLERLDLSERIEFELIQMNPEISLIFKRLNPVVLWEKPTQTILIFGGQQIEDKGLRKEDGEQLKEESKEESRAYRSYSSGVARLSLDAETVRGCEQFSDPGEWLLFWERQPVLVRKNEEGESEFCFYLNQSDENLAQFGRMKLVELFDEVQQMRVDLLKEEQV